MSQLKGRKVQVNAATDGTTFHAVGEMHDCEVEIDGNTIDVTKFGDDWVEKIQGLRDGSWSLSGFYDGSDATGQVAIRDSLINDTELTLQFIIDPDAADGAQGFQQDVVVSKFGVKASVSATVDLDVSADGNGPMTLV